MSTSKLSNRKAQQEVSNEEGVVFKVGDKVKLRPDASIHIDKDVYSKLKYKIGEVVSLYKETGYNHYFNLIAAIMFEGEDDTYNLRTVRLVQVDSDPPLTRVMAKKSQRFTSVDKLEKIKYNLIDIFGEALRYSKVLQLKYPEEEDKIKALTKFTQDIKPIKDLAVLQDMRIKYEGMSKLSNRKAQAETFEVGDKVEIKPDDPHYNHFTGIPAEITFTVSNFAVFVKFEGLEHEYSIDVNRLQKVDLDEDPPLKRVMANLSNRKAQIAGNSFILPSGKMSHAVGGHNAFAIDELTRQGEEQLQRGVDLPYDDYEAVYKVMDELGWVRVVGFSKELNVTIIRSLTFEQLKTILTEAKFYRRFVFDILNKTGEIISSGYNLDEFMNTLREYNLTPNRSYACALSIKKAQAETFEVGDKVKFVPSENFRDWEPEITRQLTGKIGEVVEIDKYTVHVDWGDNYTRKFSKHYLRKVDKDPPLKRTMAQLSNKRQADILDVPVRIKDYDLVVPGDMVEDYNNYVYEVIEKGLAHDLRCYDDVDNLCDVDPNARCLAVEEEDSGECRVFTYDEDEGGAVVYEPKPLDDPPLKRVMAKRVIAGITWKNLGWDVSYGPGGHPYPDLTGYLMREIATDTLWGITGTDEKFIQLDGHAVYDELALGDTFTHEDREWELIAPNGNVVNVDKRNEEPEDPRLKRVMAKKAQQIFEIGDKVEVMGADTDWTPAHLNGEVGKVVGVDVGTTWVKVKFDTLEPSIFHFNTKLDILRKVDKDPPLKRTMAQLSNKRQANILDYPNPGLALDVWQDNGKIKPRIKNFMMDKLEEALTLAGLPNYNKWMHEINIIGSITGYLYNDKTDIDTHIQCSLSEINKIEGLNLSDEQIDEKLKEVRKSLNMTDMEVAPGTQHPIEYTFENEAMKANVKSTGIYELTEDKWISPPRSVVVDYDLMKIAPEIVKLAQGVMGLIDTNLGEALRDIIDLKELEEAMVRWPEDKKNIFKKKISSKLEELESDLQNIVDVSKKTIEKRHEEYSPYSEGNIAFKFLQKFGYIFLAKSLESEFMSEDTEKIELEREDVSEVKDILKREGITLSNRRQAHQDYNWFEFKVGDIPEVKELLKKEGLSNKRQGLISIFEKGDRVQLIPEACEGSRVDDKIAKVLKRGIVYSTLLFEGEEYTMTLANAKLQKVENYDPPLKRTMANLSNKRKAQEIFGIGDKVRIRANIYEIAEDAVLEASDLQNIVVGDRPIVTIVEDGFRESYNAKMEDGNIIVIYDDDIIERDDSPERAQDKYQRGDKVQVRPGPYLCTNGEDLDFNLLEDEGGDLMLVLRVSQPGIVRDVPANVGVYKIILENKALIELELEDIIGYAEEDPPLKRVMAKLSNRKLAQTEPPDTLPIDPADTSPEPVPEAYPYLTKLVDSKTTPADKLKLLQETEDATGIADITNYIKENPEGGAKLWQIIITEAFNRGGGTVLGSIDKLLETKYDADFNAFIPFLSPTGSQPTINLKIYSFFEDRKLDTYEQNIITNVIATYPDVAKSLVDYVMKTYDVEYLKEFLRSPSGEFIRTILPSHLIEPYTANEAEKNSMISKKSISVTQMPRGKAVEKADDLVIALEQVVSNIEIPDYMKAARPIKKLQTILESEGGLTASQLEKGLQGVALYDNDVATLIKKDDFWTREELISFIGQLKGGTMLSNRYKEKDIKFFPHTVEFGPASDVWSGATANSFTISLSFKDLPEMEGMPKEKLISYAPHAGGAIGFARLTPIVVNLEGGSKKVWVLEEVQTDIVGKGYNVKKSVPDANQSLLDNMWKDWYKIIHNYIIKLAKGNGIDEIWIPTSVDIVAKWKQQDIEGLDKRWYPLYDGMAKKYGGELKNPGVDFILDEDPGIGVYEYRPKEMYVIDVRAVPRTLIAKFKGYYETTKRYVVGLSNKRIAQEEFHTGDSVKFVNLGEVVAYEGMEGLIGKIVNIIPDEALYEVEYKKLGEIYPSSVKVYSRRLELVDTDPRLKRVMAKLSNKRKAQQEFKIGDRVSISNAVRRFPQLAGVEGIIVAFSSLGRSKFAIVQFDSKAHSYRIAVQRLKLVDPPLKRVMANLSNKRVIAFDWSKIKQWLVGGAAIATICLQLGCSQQELIEQAPSDVKVLIEEQATIQISQDTKDLAKLIYSEAGNQSLEGQQAVANAVANRVNLWGKSVNTVIYMKYTDGTKYQFNGVEGREWNDAGTLIDNSDASINPIIDLAQNTIDGSLADITGGATFFRNPAKATNAWFQGKIDSGAFIETNSIGSHVFYREKKYDRK